MTDFEKWAKALALTESNDNPHAWGDNGKACGRWQMHPDFVDGWLPTNENVAESWDDLFHDTLLNFYNNRIQAGVEPHKVAMEFHLSRHAVAEGKDDPGYAARFAKFYGAP
jgi:hypothetical protein